MNSTSTAAVDSQANSIFIRGHGLVRYMAQGELDPNFASPTLPWTPQALVVGASGKIFAGGVLATEAGGSAFALAAFDANGSVDSTFAHNGTSEVAVSGRDSIFALATQPDCRIVAAGLAGSSDTSSNPQLVLARYVDQ